MGKLELNSSVQYIKGVGDKMAKYLNKLDICTIYDILTFYPREYEDRREITRSKVLCKYSISLSSICTFSYSSLYA